MTDEPLIVKVITIFVSEFNFDVREARKIFYEKKHKVREWQQTYSSLNLTGRTRMKDEPVIQCHFSIPPRGWDSGYQYAKIKFCPVSGRLLKVVKNG